MLRFTYIACRIKIRTNECAQFIMYGMKKVKLPLLCSTVAPGKSRQMASCSENGLDRYGNIGYRGCKIQASDLSLVALMPTLSYYFISLT
jgi:hypothetical protein